DTQIAMSGVGSHGTFVHLYINGIYWGLYNPVERPDAAFAALYLGGEDEDYYSVSHGGSHGGSASRFNYLKNTLTNKDMSNPENYAEIQEYLNVESYIDYVMLSWFGGVGDWPGNNWWGANRNEPPGPFEYFLWDAEWSWETTRGHNNGWVSPNFRSNNSGGPTLAAIWHCLRANNDFMMLFADRAYKHLFNDGVLTDENCIERYLTLNDFIRDAVVAESARWGDSLITVGYPRRTRNIDWFAAEAETIGPGFMADNVAKFVNSLRREGYYPDIDPPVFNIRGGPVNSDFQMVLSNPNSSGTVYYTLDGSDPRVSSPPQQANSLTIVEESDLKKVLVPSGSVDENWRGGGRFDDSNWIESSGSPGGIGYETGNGYKNLISLDLESLMYNKHSTCYIRIPFTLDVDPAFYDSLVLKIRYDDAFVAWLNGDEIARDNFTQTPDWDSDGTASHSDSQAVNLISFDVTEHIDSLKLLDNILAIQGMNNGNDSSDLLISVELELRRGGTAGGAVSPKAIEYAGPLTLESSRHVKTRVFRAGQWSALNEAKYSVDSVAGSLRITEIMYHPLDTGGPNDSDTEFIELKNITAQPINLNLVSFDKGIDFTFSDIELPAGGYVLIVKDKAAFEAKYGQDLNVAGQYVGSLDNSGERIRLLDAAGQVIHDFRYEDDWYENTDGSGYSLVVVDPVNSIPQNWDDIDTWRASNNLEGSPGAED
ncbi:MAG: CotH kinase family protein, partial [Planctomycetota bacterium]